MGFFDFLKPKKSKLQDSLKQLGASIFPKGEKDINAVAIEIQRILNNKIGMNEAVDIAIKATTISRISETFDEDRLKFHLSGYCIHLFNDAQIKQLYSYLVFLSVAATLYRKTPSEVICNGDIYSV